MNSPRQRQDYLNYERNSYEKREDYTNGLRRGHTRLGVGVSQLDGTPRTYIDRSWSLSDWYDVWNKFGNRKDPSKDI